MEKPNRPTDEAISQFVETLIRGAGGLGWAIAIPNGPDEMALPGLIVGTREYINDITSNLPDGEKYEVVPKPPKKPEEPKK